MSHQKSPHLANNSPRKGKKMQNGLSQPETIEITIAGPPVPQKRHRHVRQGGYIRVYDPSQKDKEILCKKVKEIALQYGYKWNLSPTDRYKVSILFYTPLPSSSQRRKNLLEWTQQHTAKPDLDNLEKFVLDALKETLWLDDQQIIQLASSKIFTDNPRTVIKVVKIMQDPLTPQQEAILEIFSKQRCIRLKEYCDKLNSAIHSYDVDKCKTYANSAVEILTELIEQLHKPINQAKEILCPSKKAKAKKQSAAT